MDRNEAIRRIRAWNLDSDDMEVLGELIPELKESEDERTRRAIRNLVLSVEQERLSILKITQSDILAWLEKQKRLYSDYEESELRRGLLWHLKELRNIEDSKGLPIKAKATYDDWIAWLENKSSQNLANSEKTCKVEPKFKVGDWIISDEAHEDFHICKITNVENGNYTIESIYGYKGYNTFETFEKSYHLWTIKDAKDGDVLAEHETIVLFKEIDGLNIRCYCTYHYLGYNPALHVDTLQNKEPYLPSTKEQRDLLFQKMKEAGYEWDAEKKELKKIEQKPTWGGDDEEAINLACSILYSNFNENENFDKDQMCIGEIIEKLKSLKGRVQPQSKQEWSKEDEIYYLAVNEAVDDYFNEVYADELRDWLISIKARYTWKPSD